MPILIDNGIVTIHSAARSGVADFINPAIAAPAAPDV